MSHCAFGKDWAKNIRPQFMTTLKKSSVMVYLYAFEDQDGNAGHDRGCFEFRSDGAHPHVPTASSVSVLIGLEGY